MTALLGYLAFGLNVAGNLLLARRNIAGWVVRLATNVAWVAYAIQVQGGEPMVLNHVAFFGINLYGWWNWRRSGPGVGS